MRLIFPNDVEAVSKLRPDQQLNLERWMRELDEAHIKAGSPYGDGPLAENTGVSYWLYWFNDGVEPKDALEENLSNA